MSYGKGNDARIVIRLRCSSSKSLNRDPLTIYESDFVTLNPLHPPLVLRGDQRGY
jgi:hypothetical protein